VDSKALARKSDSSGFLHKDSSHPGTHLLLAVPTRGLLVLHDCTERDYGTGPKTKRCSSFQCIPRDLTRHSDVRASRFVKGIVQDFAKKQTGVYGSCDRADCERQH